MRERSFDFLELLNMTIWALPPLVLIPRDFFPWIEMWASSKRAGRGAQQLKPLCCSEGNVVLVVCIRQQLCCHFPPFVVLAPLEGRCVDVGLDSSSGLWDADFGCTWEDAKAGGCCWTHQARWWLVPQRGFQVSGLQVSRTCFIQDLPHYNLLYPDLHPFDNIICTPWLNSSGEQSSHWPGKHCIIQPWQFPAWEGAAKRGLESPSLFKEPLDVALRALGWVTQWRSSTAWTRWSPALMILWSMARMVLRRKITFLVYLELEFMSCCCSSCHNKKELLVF